MQLKRLIFPSTYSTFVNTFDGSKHAYNGQHLITRTLKIVCGTEKTANMTADKCHGLAVYPPNVFYPIPRYKWRIFLQPSKAIEVIEMSKHSITVNTMWVDYYFMATARTVFDAIGMKNCPKIHSLLGRIL